jgi:hypothetical protein
MKSLYLLVLVLAIGSVFSRRVRFGVATDEPLIPGANPEQFVEDAKRAGVKEVRLNVYRDWVHSSPSIITNTLTTIGLLRNANILVSLVLLDLPTNDVSDFPQWAADFVHNNREVWDGVYRFIIWNEPNSHVFWRSSPQECMKLVVDTALAIWGCDEDGHGCTNHRAISAFGVAPSHNPLKFLNAALGELVHFSAPVRTLVRKLSLSVHFYPSSRKGFVKGDLSTLKGSTDGIGASMKLLGNIEKLKQVPRGTPIYVDEMGWNVGPGGLNEAGQVALYKNLLTTLSTKHPSVKNALVYRLHDDPAQPYTAGPYAYDGHIRKCLAFFVSWSSGKN